MMRALDTVQHLVETTSDVDQYSAEKQSWVGDALDAASKWAQQVGRQE